MSAKNLDQKGRHRNKIVAFRVSPEEDALIERAGQEKVWNIISPRYLRGMNWSIQLRL